MKNIILTISLAMNFILLALVAVYLFSPWLDYMALSKSLPRMCQYLEKKYTQNNRSAEFAQVKICQVK
ncbi:MAG: hypothetical protein WCT40_03385 [Candidatus Magasanikbacteria bacterium]|jgi:hypothetical protein